MRRPKYAESLLGKKRKLSEEWHPVKNGKLTPYDVVARSYKKAWWLCEKGHVWHSRIEHRVNGVGCPYCANKAVCKDNCLATINPRLAGEWHPTKNGKLTPDDVVAGSGKKAWWRCKKGHAWYARICERTKGNGCPYCSNRLVCKDNCLATTHPHLAREWHPIKNGKLTPEDVVAGCNKRVWWRCFDGHEWITAVNNRLNGRNCPHCYNKLRKEGFYKESRTRNLRKRPK